jgi:1,4-alpha-glucan branching enzyme
MLGDEWQKFANLRVLYTYQFTHPGKKLTFMGNEFAQPNEWNFDFPLNWGVLEQESHRGIQQLVIDLNQLYCVCEELHQFDFDQKGFYWIDCHDHNQSLMSFARRSEFGTFIVLLNFTPNPHQDYRLGVPDLGRYRIIFNSDDRKYGGSGTGNVEPVEAEGVACMDQPYSINLHVPPLAGIVLERLSSE